MDFRDVSTKHYSICLTGNEHNFDHLIEKVTTFSSTKSQEYLTVLVILQQKIEEIVRKEKPEIKLQGNALSSEITQAKGFNSHFELCSKLGLLDTELGTFDKSSLKELTVITEKEEKVTTVSEAILFAFRLDQSQDSLSLACEFMVKKIVKLKSAMSHSFNFCVQGMFSDQLNLVPLHSKLLDKAEEPENSAIANHFKQLKLNLDPDECLVLKRSFDHGKIKRITTELSVALANGELITTKNVQTTFSSFTDLRKESEIEYKFN